LGASDCAKKKTQLITTGLLGNYSNVNNLSGSDKGQRVFIVGVEFFECNKNLTLTL